MARERKPPVPAKISAPRSSRVLERPRLFAIMDRACRRPIVWVTGPAGSGKSTLVASYLRARGAKSVWYRVDRLDGDRGRIFDYLSRALELQRRRTKLPKASQETNLFTEFPLLFFEAFFDAMPEGSALVFDDYHDGPPSAEWDRIVLDAARSMQRGTSIIVISRDEPPASFTRPALDEAMAVVDEEMLRLTAKEATALARRRLPRRQPGAWRDAVSHIHATTGGWIAGFVLLVESVRAAGNVPHIGPQRVFDYIAAEIFDRIDPDLQDALLRTSLLPDFTLSSANAFLSEPVASRLVLRRFGLHPFVEQQKRTTGSEVVYRYHPLFRAFLVHRAEEVFGADALEKMRREAAKLLAADHRPDEAIDLLRSTDDPEQIVVLILSEAPALMRLGRMKTVEDWLALLPSERLQEDGWLLYWDGRCRLGSHPKEALQRFERAFELFGRAEQRDGADLAWAACIRAIVLDCTSLRDLDPWIARAPDWARTDRPEPVQAEIVASMTLALTYRGRASDAPVWVARGFSLAPRLEDPSLQSMLMGTILVYSATMGDIGAASALRETLRASGRPFDPLVSLFLAFAEALFSWMTGNERACLKSVEDGIAIARVAGSSHLSDRMLVMGCLSAIGRGDAQAAHRYIERLGQIAASGRPFDIASYQYALGHEALFAGDALRAAHATKTALTLVTEIDMPSLRVSALLSAASIAFEAQRIDEARSLLLQSRQGETPRPIAYSRLLLEAALELSQGVQDEGREILGRAFGLGCEIGLYNSPWPRRERLAHLCAEALEAGIESAYARELARRLELFPREPPLLVRDWPWRVQVFTLGRFELLRDGKSMDVARAGQPGPLRLLKALVALRAYGGRRIATAQVIDALWPDLEGDAGVGALNTTLHRLRRLLDCDEALELRHGQIGLMPEHCWIDLWALEKILASPDITVDRLLSIYRGPFLGSETPVGWTLAARERERDRFVHHVLRLGRALEQHGQVADAVDLYRRALLADDQPRELRAALARLGAAKSA